LKNLYKNGTVECSWQNPTKTKQSLVTSHFAKLLPENLLLLELVMKVSLIGRAKHPQLRINKQNQKDLLCPSSSTQL
jgi:hypothetical protein